MGRPDSELYRGVRLARIRDWWTISTTTLTDTEQAFLAASQEQADTEERSAEERARAQSRMIRRLRVVLTGAVALLVLALAAGGVAAVQSERAGDNAVHAGAESSRRHGRGRAGAGAAGDVPPTQTTSTCHCSWLRRPLGSCPLPSRPPPWAGCLLAAGSPLVRRDGRRGPLALDLSPDGRMVATVDAFHRVRLLDLETGELRADRPAGVERNERAHAGRSHSGRTVRRSPSARPRSRRTRSPSSTVGPSRRSVRHPAGLPRGHWRTVDVSFSRDGRFLAAALQRSRIDGAPEVASTWALVWRLDRRSEPMARRRLAEDMGLGGSESRRRPAVHPARWSGLRPPNR